MRNLTTRSPTRILLLFEIFALSDCNQFGQLIFPGIQGAAAF